VTTISTKHLKTLALLAILAVAGAAQAQVVISEVDPAGSGTGGSSYNQDWFELTNLGTTAQSLVGWSMLDNHAASNPTSPYSGTISIGNSSSGAVALTGVTSLAAGQSVVFIENTGNNASATTAEIAKFESIWFGTNVPANFLIGTYDSTGKTSVGLSQTMDMVNIFSGTASSSALVASVAFGNDGTATPLATWDNSAGLNDATLTTKSVSGVKGAFVTPNGQEIGSPGVISAVPEPEGLALALAGFGALVLTRRSKKKSLAIAA
jgi:hypothetical protein